MDKTHKLQRYDRKDYSELVEFPVEIVGRDSVVRRYTFEDSIRLYQRRISCAPIRHRDPDLIEAEVHHCRARIEQLRRSYFHRYGWGTPDGTPGAEQWFGDLSGELAAFLCRVFSVDGRPEVRIDPVLPDTDGVSAWYVLQQSASAGMLLYLHRFDGTAADSVRERFFNTLKELDRTGRAGGDAEKLLAFHHTVDCGFVLTGRGGDFAAFVHPREDAPPPAEVPPTPWDDVLEIIRKGEHELALRRCREIVKAQPWHRNAYVAGAMLAVHLGDPLAGEDLAFVGTKYFPKDGPLHYYVGVCRFALGRDAAGEQALREALECSPDLIAARLGLAVRLLDANRHREASHLLRQGRGVDPDDRRIAAEADNLERWLRWRVAVVGGGGVGLVLAGLGLVGAGMSLGLASTGAGVGIVALGVALAAVAELAFRGHVRLLADKPRFEDLGQGLRRLHRRSAPASVVS